jgi:hypothetical protein
MSESTYTETWSNSERTCPYCKASHRPEHDATSEDVRIEECSACEKKYYAHDSLTITLYGKPDCELNGERHMYTLRHFRDGHKHGYCSVCDKREPIAK